LRINKKLFILLFKNSLKMKQINREITTDFIISIIKGLPEKSIILLNFLDDKSALKGLFRHEAFFRHVPKKIKEQVSDRKFDIKIKVTSKNKQEIIDHFKKTDMAKRYQSCSIYHGRELIFTHHKEGAAYLRE